MRKLLSGLIVVLIAAFVGTLALSPYHKVHTAEECRAAYAAARTHADSVAVSFKPFDDGNRAVDMRCSFVLTVRDVSVSDKLIGR
jgi:hypothetical protein